jgi:hypothetical protein
MTLEIDVWQLVSALGVILTSIAGGFVALGRMLLEQIQSNRVKDSETLRDVEREVMALKAELPEKYLRREDYIRGQTLIEAKLDAIASEVKLVQIQGARRAAD